MFSRGSREVGVRAEMVFVAEVNAPRPVVGMNSGAGEKPQIAPRRERSARRVRVVPTETALSIMTMSPGLKWRVTVAMACVRWWMCALRSWWLLPGRAAGAAMR
jgi:hypothetical protein